MSFLSPYTKLKASQGRTLTWVTSVQAIDDATGLASGTATSQTVTVPQPLPLGNKAGGSRSVEREGWLVFIGTEYGFVPEVGQSVTYLSETFRVDSVKRWDGDAATLVYQCELRN